MVVLVPLYLLAVVAAVAAAAAAAFYAAVSTPGALTRMQRALRARQQVAEARRARARARAAARAAAAPQPQPLPQQQQTRSLPLASVAVEPARRAFTIVLAGERGVGKTSYLTRLGATGEFERRYVPTGAPSARHHPGGDAGDLTLHVGGADLTLVDAPGFRSLDEEHVAYDEVRLDALERADAVVIFFDVTSRITYRQVRLIYREVVDLLGEDVPIVIVGNKVDVKDRKVKAHMINVHRRVGCHYYDISVKSLYNLLRPLEQLAHELLAVSAAEVDAPAPAPAPAPAQGAAVAAAAPQQDEAREPGAATPGPAPMEVDG
jgi:GTP-binding nuclear protein Ran